MLARTVVIASLLASAGSATRAADAEAQSRYPFAVAVQVDGSGPAASYVHDPVDGLLTNPAVTVDLAEQARAEYRALAATAFAGAGAADPPLRLEVRVGGAGVECGSARRRALVRHEVVARGRDGAEVARWTAAGEGEVAGYEAGSVTLAFARASRNAARDLEQQLDASPAVAGWLAANGYGPRSAPAPAAATPPAEADPARPPWVGFVDAALGFATTSGMASRSVDGGVRVGATHRFVYLQLAADLSGTAESPGDYAGPSALLASLGSWLVGAEGGYVHRLDRRLELRAGLGAYWLQAHAVRPQIVGAYYEVTDIEVDRGGVVGSVGAGLHYVTAPQRRFDARGRIGLDVRRFFASTFSFEPLGGDITVVRWIASLVVGLEFPARRPR